MKEQQTPLSWSPPVLLRLLPPLLLDLLLSQLLLLLLLLLLLALLLFLGQRAAAPPDHLQEAAEATQNSRNMKPEARLSFKVKPWTETRQFELQLMLAGHAATQPYY
jgi:hypothetical protein